MDNPIEREIVETLFALVALTVIRLPGSLDVVAATARTALPIACVCRRI